MKQHTHRFGSIAAASILIIFLLVISAVPAAADTTGPRYPAVGTSVTMVGGLANWTAPGRISFNDAYDAYAFIGGGAATHYLQGTTFGFAIPQDAVITGIQVEINRYAGGTGVQDNAVRLVKNGILSNINMADSSGWNLTPAMTKAYGGLGELWGETWTPNDINAANFGAVLSAQNGNSSGSGNIMVHVYYMRISVWYQVYTSTTTTVDCGGGVPVVEVGSPITCVATVEQPASPSTLSGSVDWTTDGSGVFDSGTCTLPGVGTPQTCWVSYTPSAVGSGAHTITAAYPGDAAFTASTGSQTITVNRRTPTLSITDLSVTYTGSPQEAGVSGSVEGLVSNVLYNGSSTPPTNAGIYNVTADFTPADPLTYNDLTGAPVGIFTILQAQPTLSVSNFSVVYSGMPQAALVSTSVPGTVSTVRYNDAETPPTDPGTYTVTADFLPQDETNYLALNNAPAGDFTILKAPPSLLITNSPVTYNGAPQAAAVEGSVDGTVSNIRYDGSLIAPTDAGTYAVTADFTPLDTDHYGSLASAQAGTFVIERAAPTLAVTNSPVIYSGAPQAAVVEGSVDGTVGSVRYDGFDQLPLNPGVYAVTADFTPSDDTNYRSLTGAPAGSFTILAAGPALSLEITASRDTFSGAGQVIHFTYVLTNRGDVPLTAPFTVTGGKGSVVCPAAPSLDPDAAITCTANYTTTPADVSAGVVEFSAAASAYFDKDRIDSLPITQSIKYSPYLLYLPQIFQK